MFGDEFDRIDNKRPGRWMALAFFALLFLMVVPVAMLLTYRGGLSGIWGTSALLFLAVIVGWAGLSLPRMWFISAHSPVDWVAAMMFRRVAPVPVVDESPAQLKARRGDLDGALALYKGWIEEHPKHLILRFHEADLLLREKKDPVAARRAYREASRLVHDKGARASKEEGEAERLAAAVLRDLDRVPARP